MKTGKNRYQVSIKIIDTTTGKNSEIFVSSNISESFDELGKSIHTACDIMNMSVEDQEAIKNNIEILIEKGI